MQFTEFIVKAKKNTYASGQKPTILDDGFEELTSSDGEFIKRCLEGLSN